MSVNRLTSCRSSNQETVQPIHRSPSQKSPSWRETATLISQLTGWFVASLFTFFSVDYPKNRVVEVWTQLHRPQFEIDVVEVEKGVFSVVSTSQANEGGIETTKTKEESSDLEDYEILSSEEEPSNSLLTQRHLARERAVRNLEAPGGILLGVLKKILGTILSGIQDNRELIAEGTSYTYMDHLENQYGTQATFIKELMNLKFKENFSEEVIIPSVIKALDEKKQFVFIPMVYESTVNHNFLFIINLKNGGMEYYDSKGKPPGQEKIPALGISVSEFHSKLSLELFSNKDILSRGENPFRYGITHTIYSIKEKELPHQKIWDWTNCGVFVLKFMKERLKQSNTQPEFLPIWRNQETFDFQTTLNAIGSAPQIRQELVSDLRSTIGQGTEQ